MPKESWPQTQHDLMPFRSTKSRFPWTNNNNQRVATQKQKIAKFLEKVRFPRFKKALQRYIGFLKYYRNDKPRLAKRLTPFFQLLKTTDAKTKIQIIPDIMKEFREINEALVRCCQLSITSTITW